MDLSRHFLTLGQRYTPLKNRLESIISRLDQLCSQDGDGPRDENGHEPWTRLFEWVLGINYNPPLRSLFASTLRLIRDTGNVLYNRISTEDYKESQDDIQAVSGIAEDIRDALLDYQVCNNDPYVTWVQLKLGHIDSWHSHRRSTTRATSRL